MSLSGSRSTRAVVPQLARLFLSGSVTGMPEAQLLESFISRNDEAAFEAIVTRHGPMVLKVCRQILSDPNDVDDAFQATFIVLVRRAASLRRKDLLGNWLYGVAYRVARRARSLAAQRAGRISDATPVEALSGPNTLGAGLDPDALLHLHEAVSHLPDRYRIPVVLCYFEGLTHEDAAERLGWPLGSVKGRLSRAKDLLRKRLDRRGVGLSAGVVLTTIEQNSRAAGMPYLLKLKVLRSALAVAGSSAHALAKTSTISMTVATLAQGVIHTMFVSQIRALVIPAVIGIGIVSSGASVIAFQQGPGSENEGETPVLAFAPEDDSSPSPTSDKKKSKDDAEQSSKRGHQDKKSKNKPSHAPGADKKDQNPHGPMMPMPGMMGMGGGGMSMPGMMGMGGGGMSMPGMMGMGGGGMGGMGGSGMSMPGMMGAGKSGMSMPGMMGMGGGMGGMGGSGMSMPGMMGAGKSGMSMPGMMGMGGGGHFTKSPIGSSRRQRIESVRRQLNAALASAVAKADTNPKTKELLAKLNEPIAMDFSNETPIEDVLKYLQSATSTKTSPGIPIYLNPLGLQEAEKTAQSPITIKIDGVPLKTTLRLILKQLDLAYCVHDGLLIISSPRGIHEELVEAGAELGISDEKDNPLEKELQGLESDGKFGRMGGGMM